MDEQLLPADRPPRQPLATAANPPGQFDVRRFNSSNQLSTTWISLAVGVL
jgi:hypothetical protein